MRTRHGVLCTIQTPDLGVDAECGAGREACAREESTMNRYVRSMAVIAGALVVAVAVVSGHAAAGSKLEFRLSNQLPASHHISKGIVLFAGKVKEYSKGAVEVKVFDSAQIYKDTEIVEALQEGLI
jgi:C4-dicarboxylate-binding protein DctP